MRWFTDLLLLTGLAVCCAVATEVKTNPNQKIVNGFNAPNTPYNVYVLYLNSGNAGFYGGGSLISDRHVLTAAQNIQGFVRWELGLGSVFFSQLTTQVSTQATAHPSFNAQTRDNDIGFIVLPNPVVFTATIARIALPELNVNLPLENEEGNIVGFGFHTLHGDQRSDFLKIGYQRMIADTRCTATYVVTPPYHFCAEDITHRANVCNGDLGAGFVVLDRRVDTLVGIASLITDSCNAITPTGYIRVSYYRQWIRDNTGV